MEKIIEKYKNQYPNAQVEVVLESDTGPYKKYGVVLRFSTNLYNPKFDSENAPACACGHSYERHFDSYEDMAAVGCKYCNCYHYHALPEDSLLYERVLSEAEYSSCSKSEAKYLFERHILQFELLSYKHESFFEYFGKNIDDFEKLIEEKFAES